MPYFDGDKLSKEKSLPGGISISEEAYSEIMAAKMAGKAVELRGDSWVVLSDTMRTVYSTETKSTLEIPENSETPAGYTELVPGEFERWDGASWIPCIDSLCAAISGLRYAVEVDGVVVNGIRYSGSDENMNRLRDIYTAKEESSETTFSYWKDSDGQYHQNHPVSDVRQAWLQLSLLRDSLIGQEAQYKEQIKAGQITSLDNLMWQQ